MEEDKTRLDRDKLGGTTQIFEGCCVKEVLQCAITVGAGDGDPCGSKDRRVIDVLETTEVTKNGHVGIRASSLQKAFGSVAQLKHFYTHGMGNKQELEAIAQQKGYDSCHHGNMVDEFLTD